MVFGNMKKQDVLNAIVDILNDNMYSKYHDVSPEGVADEILHVITRMGMLPAAKRCPVLLRDEHKWEGE